MNGFYRQVVEQLKAHGFKCVRQARGSHEIWSDGQFTTTVSTTCKSRHTANEIMKQAGIRHRF